MKTTTVISLGDGMATKVIYHSRFLNYEVLIIFKECSFEDYQYAYRYMGSDFTKREEIALPIFKDGEPFKVKGEVEAVEIWQVLSAGFWINISDGEILDFYKKHPDVINTRQIWQVVTTPKEKELLTEANFFEYAKFSDVPIVNQYFKDIKSIYHNAEIVTGIEKFALWLQENKLLQNMQQLAGEKELLSNAEQVGEWISTSDRLPNANCNCLIFGRFTKDTPSKVSAAFYVSKKRQFNQLGIRSKSVTHWMPYPSEPNKTKQPTIATTDTKNQQDLTFAIAHKIDNIFDVKYIGNDKPVYAYEIESVLSSVLYELKMEINRKNVPVINDADISQANESQSVNITENSSVEDLARTKYPDTDLDMNGYLRAERQQCAFIAGHTASTEAMKEKVIERIIINGTLYECQPGTHAEIERLSYAVKNAPVSWHDCEEWKAFYAFLDSIVSNNTGLQVHGSYLTRKK